MNDHPTNITTDKPVTLHVGWPKGWSSPFWAGWQFAIGAIGGTCATILAAAAIRWLFS